MVQRVELLVHAGAPSTRKDDERCKAQAEAYLAFTGRRRELERLSGQQDLQQGQEVAPSPRSTTRYPPTVAEASSNVFLDDTQSALLALESQLITPSLLPIPTIDTADNGPLGNVGLGHPVAGDIVQPYSARRLETPSSRKRKSEPDTSRVEDSFRRVPGNDGEPDVADANSAPVSSKSNKSWASYLKTPIFYSSPTHETPLKNKRRVARSPIVLTQTTLRHEEQPLLGHVNESQYMGANETPLAPQNQSHTSQNEPTSELPTSYSLSDVTTAKNSGQHHDGTQRPEDEPTTQIRILELPSAPQASPQEKRPRQALRVREECKGARATKEGYADSGPHPDRPTEVPSGHRPSTQLNTGQHHYESDTSHLPALPATVHPPPPSTALGRFTTHITPSLQQLSDNPNLAHSYKPISTTRALRPLERGHWLVDTSPMPLAEQRDFWLQLGAHVSAGIMGWGVWCARQPAEDGSAAVGTVRAYCWGEVVQHVYLMLYVVSNSRVRKLGLQWRDAEGKAVVQMRGST